MCERDYLYFYQIYSLQVQLETLGAFKIVISRSTSLKLNLLKRKLYVDIKNGLYPGNPIGNESVDLISPCIYIYKQNKNKLYF